MAALSKSQRLILAAAADRDSGAVLPLPEALSIRGRALKTTLERLFKRGLIAKRPAQEGEPAWSESRDEESLALEITPEGRALVAAERPAQSPGEERRAGPAARPSKLAHRESDEQAAPRTAPAPIRPGTKQAMLAEMLSRPEGATIADIASATGWLPHTARAAVTGLKKKGFAVLGERREDRMRYRLAPRAADHNEKAER